jgi:site-specific recombinase XerD
MKSKLPMARIVVDEKGKTPGRQMLLHRLQRFLKKQSMRHWTYHQIRHFFVTELIRRGGGLEAVRMLAGHSKLEMTQRYAHATAEDLREVMKKLSD